MAVVDVPQPPQQPVAWGGVKNVSAMPAECPQQKSGKPVGSVRRPC
jgi:hypothetical protein